MIIDREGSVLIREDYMHYSAETILYRAISDLRDGLKPSQRRILTTMLDEKVFEFTKSQDVTGSTMKLHPHGSTYPTVVNMVQEDNNNLPFIIGQGNFGYHTIEEFQPAHERYTEIKLSKFAIDNMSNMDQINKKPSYDGRKLEPECLPMDFPAILCYNTKGMAVGFEVRIPSYNMVEVCEATKELIKGNEMPILYPDFPTKGIIQKDERSAKTNIIDGTGSFIVRGRAIIDKDTIVISEIPYTTTCETVVNKIIELMEAKKLEGVKDVLNTTDYENGFNITVFLKRGADAEEILNKLYAYTPLQEAYNSNIGYIYKDELVYSGIETILRRWIEWKREAVILQLTRKKNEMESKIHLLKGINFIYNYLDEAINIIRFSKAPIQELMSRFPLDEPQANYINNLSISNYNVHKMDRLLKELRGKMDEIKSIENKLNNPASIDSIIIDGLNTIIKKYGLPRKTVIEDFSIVKPKIEKIVEKYSAEIGITKEGYVCKSKTTVDNCLLKPGDKFIYKCMVKNTGELLVFGKTGNCYKIQVDDIPVTLKAKMGVTFKELGVDKDKYLSYAYIDETVTKVVMIYKEGRITVLDANSFKTATKRKKLSNSLANFTILSSISIKEDIDISIYSDKDKLIKTLNTGDFLIKSTRNSQGVQVTKRIIESIKF